MSEKEPRAKKPPRVVKTLRIAESGYDAAVECGRELGMDWSEFARQAIAEKVARHRAQAKKQRTP